MSRLVWLLLALTPLSQALVSRGSCPSRPKTGNDFVLKLVVEDPAYKLDHNAKAISQTSWRQGTLAKALNSVSTYSNKVCESSIINSKGSYLHIIQHVKWAIISQGIGK